MFSEQPVVVPSRQPQSPEPVRPKFKNHRKKLIIIAAVSVFAVLIGGLVWLVIKNGNGQSTPNNGTDSQNQGSASNLPGSNFPVSESELTATTTFSDLAIEYLSFADFYTAPDNNLEAAIDDYELPINVKIDVVNYYDVSRKLNIDPGIESLNQYGFATVANPWQKTAPDFYSVYSTLEEKQLPVLVTADFIIYYYQNILKQAFKDIEENVFYDNLWDINKQMYETARSRYESRLATIGDVNDTILEAERLETIFFAVALELLKPAEGQVAVSGALDEGNKFAASEADRFNFVAPPYLKEDIAAELALIKAAQKTTVKSPVLLYERDYSVFAIPSDYRLDAKLHNFYLATRWLNSVWPLNYRSADCPSCLLDKEDWRISLTAASFISQDFSSLPDVKNKWARIYKTISYFQGLREDLNFVYYRDSLVDNFGADYNLEKIFGDGNPEAAVNMEKLRNSLLAIDFSSLRGGLSKTNSIEQPQIGLKVLVASYWPNDYIFSQLISPSVTGYLGTKPASGNIVDCQKISTARCNGIALDVVNLVWPVSNNPYFEENTNYGGYSEVASTLRQGLEDNKVWHTSEYWTTLQTVKSYLMIDKKNQPNFASSLAWQSRMLDTAVGAWVNLQLPLKKFTVNQLTPNENLNGLIEDEDNSYVEPNLNLVNELIANNVMILKMFSALQLNVEIPTTIQNIQAASNNLNLLKGIITKELSGESLNRTDSEVINDFVKQLKVETATVKDLTLTIKPAIQKKTLKEDLSRLRLMVVVHKVGDRSAFSIGPVWSYQESRN